VELLNLCDELLVVIGFDRHRNAAAPTPSTTEARFLDERD
jgi:hypothetical protein